SSGGSCAQTAEHPVAALHPAVDGSTRTVSGAADFLHASHCLFLQWRRLASNDGFREASWSPLLGRMKAAHVDDEIRPFDSAFCGPYAGLAFEEPPAPVAVCRQAAAAGDAWKIGGGGCITGGI